MEKKQLNHTVIVSTKKEKKIILVVEPIHDINKIRYANLHIINVLVNLFSNIVLV